MKISYTRTVLFNCSSRREWWSGNTPTEISMRWIKHKWEERTLLNAKYNRKYTLAKSDLQQNVPNRFSPMQISLIRAHAPECQHYLRY